MLWAKIFSCRIRETHFLEYICFHSKLLFTNLFQIYFMFHLVISTFPCISEHYDSRLHNEKAAKNTFLFTTVKCLSVKSEINSGSIFAVNWCSFNEFIFNAFSISSCPCSCGFSSTKLTFQQSSKQTFQWNFVHSTLVPFLQFTQRQFFFLKRRYWIKAH